MVYLRYLLLDINTNYQALNDHDDDHQGDVDESYRLEKGFLLHLVDVYNLKFPWNFCSRIFHACNIFYDVFSASLLSSVYVNAHANLNQ